MNYPLSLDDFKSFGKTVGQLIHDVVSITKKHSDISRIYIGNRDEIANLYDFCLDYVYAARHSDVKGMILGFADDDAVHRYAIILDNNGQLHLVSHLDINRTETTIYEMDQQIVAIAKMLIAAVTHIAHLNFCDFHDSGIH